MRKHLLLLLLGFVTAAAFAQNEEAEIRLAFTEYFKIVAAKNNDATLDYMYPKMFEIIPRDGMKTMMDEMYADTAMVINFADYKLHSVSPVVTDGAEKFALAKYSFNMLIKINPAPGDEPVDPENYLSTFEMAYGKGNASYNKSTQIYTVKAEREMFAISGPSYTGWKFIENKKAGKMLLEKLLPKKIIKKFL